MKLDETDMQILRCLQNNGKMTNIQLSAEVNLSPAPTLERVKKLENSGYIKSYHAQLNAEKLGFEVIVFIEVGFNLGVSSSLQHFINMIQTFPEVTECYHTTGEYDLLLKVYAPSILEYQNFVLNKLVQTQFVSKVNSKIVLSTAKFCPELPLNEVDTSVRKR